MAYIDSSKLHQSTQAIDYLPSVMVGSSYSSSYYSYDPTTEAIINFVEIAFYFVVVLVVTAVIAAVLALVYLSYLLIVWTGCGLTSFSRDFVFNYQ